MFQQLSNTGVRQRYPRKINQERRAALGQHPTAPTSRGRRRKSAVVSVETAEWRVLCGHLEAGASGSCVGAAGCHLRLRAPDAHRLRLWDARAEDAVTRRCHGSRVLAALVAGAGFSLTPPSELRKRRRALLPGPSLWPQPLQLTQAGGAVEGQREGWWDSFMGGGQRGGRGNRRGPVGGKGG